jgi:cellulose synthase/poly-beta-1,6-N-acetylglucosamine synthase-like glycosyltransferase
MVWRKIAMLIPILDDYYDAGYLPRPVFPALTPFFPNCNLAVRRTAFDQAGGYDAAMTAGEDADLCRRVAGRGWELVYQSDAVVRHEPRRTLSELLRQWWAYGYAGAVHFQKARTARFEVYWTLEAWPRIHRHRALATCTRFPFAGIVFLTYFPLVLMLMLGAGVAAVAGLKIVGAVLACAAILGFGFFVVRRTPGQKLRARLGHGLLVLLVNSACTLGCLASTFRHGRIFLYPGI